MSVSLASLGFVLRYKAVNANLWVKNTQLAMWSVGIGAAGVIMNDGADVLEHGFFLGYTMQVWCTIALQAFGGITVAIVARHADSVAKGFATGLSLVGTCALSAYMFDFVITPAYLSGTLLVLLSVYTYSTSSSPSAMSAAPTPRSCAIRVGNSDDRAC